MGLLNISESLLLSICGFGALQGVLLALLVYFHPKSSRSNNLFLALFLFSVSLVMTLPYSLQLLGWQNSFFVQPIPLLAGPLLYLYVRSFKERIRLKTALPHFVPFFLFFFACYWNVSTLAARFPGSKSVPPELLHNPGTMILNYIKLGQSITYFFVARKILKSYANGHGSDGTGRIFLNLSWAKLIINGYMLIVLSAIVIFSLMISFPQHFNLLLLITMAVSTPYIYTAAFKGIIQPAGWQLQLAGIADGNCREIPTIALANEPEQFTVHKSNEKMDDVAAKIIALMERDRLYRESDLTLRDLADKLQIPCYLVSQAINDVLKKNFYDVINAYRVEEAKRLLLHPDNRNFTILSVGFEAGFNSKTTFNTVFKKFTGQTPSTFKELQLQTAALAG